MKTYIAEQIKKAAQVVDGTPTNIAAGQAKYRAYFITIPYKLYSGYQKAVDAILTVDNCTACIVTE